MPIDSRIVESRTPIFWRMSAGTPEWVMLAGRPAYGSDNLSPLPPKDFATLSARSGRLNMPAIRQSAALSARLDLFRKTVHCGVLLRWRK
jgi:hypothetical protein